VAGTAVQRRLTWRLGRITRRLEQTPRVKTLTLAVPGWPSHQAGQHVDVRLTAPDGYHSELDQFAARGDGFEVLHTLTRAQPVGWSGYSKRIDLNMLRDVVFDPQERPLCMVCGPTALVETVANTLVELGHPADRVKTERFGPTGP
jgi:ferredoxin-NADP reductase